MGQTEEYQVFTPEMQKQQVRHALLEMEQKLFVARMNARILYGVKGAEGELKQAERAVHIHELGVSNLRLAYSEFLKSDVDADDKIVQTQPS